VYEVTVLGVPDAHDLQRISRGVLIDGRRTQPAEVQQARTQAASGLKAQGQSRSPERRSQSTLVITIREGRNREIRKLCDAIGHPVDRLKRIAIGPIRDSRLKPGFWRELTGDEVSRLRKSVSTTRPKPSPKP
jgi:23S rRNA pseudouridine2605 synthase